MTVDFQEIVKQLTNPQICGLFDEEARQRIIHIIWEAKKLATDRGESNIPEDCLRLLNEKAMLVMESDLKSFFVRNPNIRSYAFPLVGCNLTNANDLIFASKFQPGLVASIGLPDGLLDLLKQDNETRAELILTLNHKDFSDDMNNFLNCFPLKKQVCVLSWPALEEEMAKFKLEDGERQIIVREIWAKHSELRQELTNSNFPGELINELETIGSEKLNDLEMTKVNQFKTKLTDYQKSILNKVIRKSASFLGNGGKWASRKQQGQKFVSEINHASNALSEIMNGNALEPACKLLDDLGYKEVSDMDEIRPLKSVLSQAANLLTPFPEPPYESDENLIASIDDGMALRGVCLGMIERSDDLIFCTNAQKTLFKTPNACKVVDVNRALQRKNFCFSNGSDAMQFKAIVFDMGLSFAEKSLDRFSNYLGNSDGTSKSVIILSFLARPTASFQLEREDLVLTREATSRLDDIVEATDAGDFLDEFGSHFLSGLQQLGSIMCNIIEVSLTQEEENAKLVKLANELMDRSLSCLQCQPNYAIMKTFEEPFFGDAPVRVQGKYETETRGPSITNPQLFAEVSKYLISDWHVIDRNVSSTTVIAIWKFIAKKLPDKKKQAELLRSAWLKKVTQASAIEMVVREVRKTAINHQAQQFEDTKNKILTHLGKMDKYTSIYCALDDDVVLKILQEFFQLMSSCRSLAEKENEENPWTIFVSERKEFSNFLIFLARQQINGASMPKTGKFLRETIDDELSNVLKQSDCLLDETVRSFLKPSAKESEELVAFKKRREVVGIVNLTKILREEYAEANSRQDLSLFQWRMSSLVEAALQAEDVSNIARNSLFDLLTSKFNWLEGKFQFPLTSEAFLQLTDEIDKLTLAHPKQNSTSETITSDASELMECDEVAESEEEIQDVAQQLQRNRKETVSSMLSKETTETSPVEDAGAYRKVDIQIKPYNPQDPVRLKRKQESDMKNKKSFFRLLTDSPPSKTTATTYDEQLCELKRKLIQRLRHRMDLESLQIQANMVKIAPYDVLLDLVDDFGPAGVYEIYLLLLERRFTVPVFNPLTGEHYLTLLREIPYEIVPNEPPIRLGSDTSLFRIALISCCQPDESQAAGLLKSLFSLDSFHVRENNDDSLTKEALTIDIGIGYIAGSQTSKASASHHAKPHKNQVMVIHVTGDLIQAWKFIKESADLLLVEDDDGAFFSLVGRTGISSWIENENRLVVWTPSMRHFVRTRPNENLRNLGFSFEGVSAPMGRPLINALSSLLQDAMSWSARHGESRQCLSSCELLEEGTFSIKGIVPFNVDLILSERVEKVANTRERFLLQSNFRQQFIYEDMKNEKRFDQQALMQYERLIAQCYDDRKRDAESVGQIPLVKTFIDLLENRNASVRVMALRQFEQGLNARTELELKVLQDEINNYYDLIVGGVAKDSKPGTADECVTKYAKAKQNYREAMLHLEHIWRELSHLYVADPRKYYRLPELAARHLLDGFSIELLDGDANLVNLPWISAVLTSLNGLIEKQRNRIFVLSVMGVQSSGKSTLLNTMFGIKMRTSVGQCTRGINMQLLPVEGRKEYDYVLVLDTEGTRSPDFYGMVGNEKRDNQMATLSILLADATIVVNPGENDAAVKEILPIVLLAYQGSKLAEDNGGRLSSMMFFIYNRIDTTQKDRLTNIIQALAKSLMDAFKTVREMGGYRPRDNDNVDQANCLFRHFKLDASNSSESDVRILGQNKISFTPPDNIPDPNYGESLVEFREHIERRVTGKRDGVQWKSRTPNQLSAYLHQIWKCICSSDFNLQFTHVLERAAFDLLDNEYQKIKHDLASGYQTQFGDLRKKMITIRDDSHAAESLSVGNQKSKEMQSKLDRQMDFLIIELNKRVEDATLVKGREKWAATYNQNWITYKEQQQQYWHQQIKYAFDTIFFYDQQVERLRKDMRQTISDLYKAVNPNQNYTEEDLKKEFHKIVERYLNQAKRDYPSVDVGARIRAVYSESAIIKKHGIDVFSSEVEILCMNFVYRFTFSPVDYSHKKSDKLDKDQASILSRLKNGVAKFFKRTKTSDTIADDERTEERLTEISRELRLCLKTIQEHAKNMLLGVACYDDSIVSSMIEKTDQVLSNCVKKLPIEHSHRTFAHTFTRVVLVEFLQEIQYNWERHNSVPAKFGEKANLDALSEFFFMVASGANKMKLFGLLIQQKFSNLRSAFEAEMVMKTVDIVKRHTWLYEFKSTQNYMDEYLVKLIDNKEVCKLINYIKKPQELLTEVLLLLISGMAKDLLSTNKGWNNYVEVLIRTIRTSTANALEVKNKRASKFVESLQRGLLDALDSDVLGQSLARELGDEYSELDNELEGDFRNTCQNHIIEVIRNQANPADNATFSRHISQLVVQQLRRENAAGAMPRCEECCPWCRSICILEAGHDPEKIKHDTLHQPAGLGGISFYRKNTLVPEMCSRYEDERELVQTNKDGTEERWHFRDWNNKYPTWKKPHSAQDWPLREYIFYHFHEDFANAFGKNPCDCMISTYNQDLNIIKQAFKKTHIGAFQLYQ